MKLSLKIYLVLLLVFFSIVYFLAPFKFVASSNIFLTISTFLFAIFAGFFISRQGQRYSSIRDRITEFDGEITAVYRNFGHISTAMQAKAKEIIENHYKLILKKQSWDYHFTHKSNTILSLHKLIDECGNTKVLPSLTSISLQRIMESLQNLQLIRKNMISLHNERIPLFQYILIYFLGILLLATVSIIPSQTNLLESILKGAFSTCAVFVLVLLHQFDKLRFFEGLIGEGSAQDVLDIFSGKK